jgi:hypothetical protein
MNYLKSMLVGWLGLTYLASAASAEDQNFFRPVRPVLEEEEQPPVARARAIIILPDGRVIEAVAVAVGNNARAEALADARETGVAPAKYRLGITADFFASGIRVRNVEPGSPLRKMTCPGQSGQVFAAEPNDTILGIRNGSGQFVLPTSAGAVAAALNSLPGPRTQVLVGDVNGTGTRLFDIDLGGDGGVKLIQPVEDPALSRTCIRNGCR